MQFISKNSPKSLSCFVNSVYLISSTNSLILAHLHPLNCKTTTDFLLFYHRIKLSLLSDRSFLPRLDVVRSPINYPRRFFHPFDGGGNFFNVDISYLGRGLASLSFPSLGDAISGSCLPLRGSVSANSTTACAWPFFFFFETSTSQLRLSQISWQRFHFKSTTSR